MVSTRTKGTLKKWLDDKGYGFISPDKGSKDVFVHISAFDRNIPRKPKVGDTIFYHVTMDNNGKTKAVDAAIEGVTPVIHYRSPKPKQSYQNRGRKSSWKFFMLCIVLIIGIGSTLYKRFQTTGVQSFPSSIKSLNFMGSSTSNSFSKQYTCAGKIYCSQMTSCAEAKFYIRNCPNTKMDGDGDGIPCESQFCN